MKSPAMARNPATRPSSSATQTSWRTSTTSRKYSRSSSAVWPVRAWRSGKARRRERRQRSFTASKSAGSYPRMVGPGLMRRVYAAPALLFWMPSSADQERIPGFVPAESAHPVPDGPAHEGGRAGKPGDDVDENIEIDAAPEENEGPHRASQQEIARPGE